MSASAYYELRECLLKVENVSLTLGGKLILRDVNVEVKNIVRPGMQQGQVVALLGPSGIGKTRLFRILAGLDEPDSGQVLVGDPPKYVVKGEVGVVAQNYPLFRHRTVASNLVVAGKQAGLDSSAAKEKADKILSEFNLEEHARKYPVQLSGGQRQRVAIAQQFMCSEHFLLMDEPFSGLDLNAIERVITMINEMAAADEMKTFIIVTHDITAALEVADTVWILGRDRDENDKIIPGARIQKNYNLIDLGLAWRHGVTEDPAFIDLMKEIRAIYPKL
ncbi:MAG: ABC transporter ATP-binding protein [Armatimonadetes bacterium 55-13]|nr:ABC transporter ATP-binding protein [Armatimonadota bacterium]OJU65691.1 MAG: ABC transporter ATP-binding protein [Armatimonadetes bacterium 55-13]